MADAPRPKYAAEPVEPAEPSHARRNALIALGGLGGVAAAAAAFPLLRGDGRQPTAPLAEVLQPTSLRGLATPGSTGSAQPTALAIEATPDAVGGVEQAKAAVRATSAPGTVTGPGVQPSGSQPAGSQPLAVKAAATADGRDLQAEMGVNHDALKDNQGAPARWAPVDPSAAYRAAPPAATLTATSPLAPKLTLKTTPAWHLARRAAQAPSPEIVEEITQMGAAAWIDRQLDPASIDDRALESFIAGPFKWSVLSTAQVAVQTGGKPWFAAPQTINALLLRARSTKRVLLESVVEVMGDHVYVAVDGKSNLYSGEYDRLLRSKALGRYADLLHAALTHPALLTELDNVTSTKQAPNENLGRELLELYTVGVGQYTEADIAQSALLLTGHSADGRTSTYRFRAENHHVGPLKVMGFRHPNATPDAGPAALRAYVDYLTRHPATAKRLATRFAVRFIRDDPGPALVADLAQAYLKADTSIAALVRATLTHPEFEASVGRKWRRPLEFVSSIARAAQVSRYQPKATAGSDDLYNTGLYGYLIRTARHTPRAWTVVNGYPDQASFWNSTSITLSLWNGAQDAVIGDKVESGMTSWTRALSIKAGDNALATARRITWHLTGYQWPEQALLKVAGLLANGTAGGADASSVVSPTYTDDYAAQAVRVTFASPYGFLR